MKLHRKKFRTQEKSDKEIFSADAYNLTNLFDRWIKDQVAYENIDRLKEMMLLERFYDTVSEELRVWLFDKKPLTPKDAGKLADEYTIIHQAYTTQKPYYRTEIRDEVTNSDKKGNKYTGNKTEHINGTVENYRYTTNIKSPEIICFSCNQKGHTNNKCIFDTALEHVQCWQCQTFGHYKSNCNVGDKVKTNLLIKHCVRRNIKRCIKTQDHESRL